MTSRPVDFESLAVAFRAEIALHPPTVDGYLTTADKAKARSGQSGIRLSIVQEAALFRIYRKASGVEDWTNLDKIG